MYHRGLKWDSDAAYEIRQLGSKMASDNLTQHWDNQALQKSMENIALAQDRAMGGVHMGFSSLVASQQKTSNLLLATYHQLDTVQGSLEQLKAAFDWAMGSVIWNLEVQNKGLQDILQTLQAPLDTQAKELRKRAEEVFSCGWYDEALSDFLESERKNYRDFAVLHAIGIIYLYHKQPANFEQAREYFLKAGKYATPQSTYHAALGYMYAGFVCYLMEDDQKAIEYATRAKNLYPNLTEAWYNLAKFAGAARQPLVAIPALEHAIRTDKTYALKASTDSDFASIEADVKKLMERLYTEAKQKAKELWKQVKEEIQPAHIPDPDRKNLNEAIANVESALKDDTYFGYCDVVPLIEKCSTVLHETIQFVERREREKERERKEREQREREERERKEREQREREERERKEREQREQREREERERKERKQREREERERTFWLLVLSGCVLGLLNACLIQLLYELRSNQYMFFVPLILSIILYMILDTTVFSSFWLLIAKSNIFICATLDFVYGIVFGVSSSAALWCAIVITVLGKRYSDSWFWSGALGAAVGSLIIWGIFSGILRIALAGVVGGALAALRGRSKLNSGIAIVK